jgi:hypothetical protein
MDYVEPLSFQDRGHLSKGPGVPRQPGEAVEGDVEPMNLDPLHPLGARDRRYHMDLMALLQEMEGQAMELLLDTAHLRAIPVG